MAHAPKKQRKQRTPVPKDEAPDARFRRLVKQRVPRAMKALESVAKLGGRGYTYTPEQAKKIAADITAAADRAASAFAQPGQQTGSTGEYDI